MGSVQNKSEWNLTGNLSGQEEGLVSKGMNAKFSIALPDFVTSAKEIKDKASGSKERVVADEYGNTYKVKDKTEGIDDLASGKISEASKNNSTNNGKDLKPNIEPSNIRKINNSILDDMVEAGGHLLEKHVSKTDNDLIKRAAQEGVPSTSFSDKNTALRATRDNIRQNADTISNWLNDSNSKGYIIIEADHGVSIGKGVNVKNNGSSFSNKVTRNLTKSELFLVKDPTMPNGYKIITGYPVF